MFPSVRRGRCITEDVYDTFNPVHILLFVMRKTIVSTAQTFQKHLNIISKLINVLIAVFSFQVRKFNDDTGMQAFREEGVKWVMSSLGDINATHVFWSLSNPGMCVFIRHGILCNIMCKLSKPSLLLFRFPFEHILNGHS